jgi:rhodanese-related sulfurtransferase
METKTQPGHVENVAAAEFQSRLAEDSAAFLLDVRTPAEFNAGHLPNAINLDVLDDCFNTAVSDLDKTKTYFVYCRSGGRSGQACLCMADQGFAVVNLRGGINSWTGEIVSV